MPNNRQQTACAQCGEKIDIAALACPACGTPRTPTTKRNFEGLQIGGTWLIKNRIASGGMGEVYRAEHTRLNQSFAVKFLHARFASDEGFGKRFENEANLVNQISHPMAVKVNDFGALADGTLYFVMEYVDGPSLTDVVDDLRMLPINMAVRIAIQVAEVLASAHQLRIIHRDVKPDNIMLIPSPGDSYPIKVLDFGIAKLLDDNESSQTETGVMFGTPEYMSPEQASGKQVDERSDIYSLGLVLYFMLAGSPPFHGKNKLRIIHQQAREEPDRVEMRARQPLPRALSELIHEMLSKDPDGRPARMADVVRRLEELELRETTSFEEARARSAIFHINENGAWSEGVDSAQQVSQTSEDSRTSTDPFGAQAFAQDNSSPVRTGEQEALTRVSSGSGGGGVGRSPVSSGPLPSERFGIQPARGQQLAGVTRANDARRSISIGQRLPQRTIQGVSGAYEPTYASSSSRSSSLGLFAAILFSFVGVGFAGWLAFNFMGDVDAGQWLSKINANSKNLAISGLDAPESLIEASSRSTHIAPDESSDVESPEIARLERSEDVPGDGQESERESTTENRTAEAGENSGASEPFDEQLERARVLVAAAKMDEARGLLDEMSASGSQQESELTSLETRVQELSNLHEELDTALANDNCDQANSVAQRLSEQGGSHHLAAWRSELRACDQPAVGTSGGAASPSEQPTREQAESEPSPAERQSNQESGQGDGSGQQPQRQAEPSDSGEAPSGLPGDLSGESSPAPEEAEQPTREREPAPPPTPQPSQPSEPSPVMPPPEL